jgi:hypothetical protein
MFEGTSLIEAVGALIAAMITGFLIPYIKSKSTSQQQESINAWVRIAVAAAEQIYADGGQGKEKTNYVIDFLNSKGISIDRGSVTAMIEAAVHELNNGLL